MTRNNSSYSFGELISMCPNTEEDSPRSDQMYSREYRSMLDGFEEDGLMEDQYGNVLEKKRRLSVEQVKALERNFEVENKLEPERKVKLAKELGLQPRQVAVWFQNRRARWKTKQLERDYGVLKASFDSLKKNYESLKLDKQALIKEIKELKSKLNGENSAENMSIEEEETIEPVKLNSITELCEDMKLNKIKTDSVALVSSGSKSDGSSDSNSSVISNDQQSPNTWNSTSIIRQNQEQLLSSFIFNSSSSSSPSPPSSNGFTFSDSNPDRLGCALHDVYRPQFVKHNFFGGDEACNNFFEEEQALPLHWYCADQWA